MYPGQQYKNQYGKEQNPSYPGSQQPNNQPPPTQQYPQYSQYPQYPQQQQYSQQPQHPQYPNSTGGFVMPQAFPSTVGGYAPPPGPPPPLSSNYNYPSPPFPQSTGTYPPPASNNGYPSFPTSTQYQPPPGPPPPPTDNNNSGSYLPPPEPPPSTQPPPPYYQYQPPPEPPPSTSTTSAPTSTQYQPPPGPPPPSTTTKYQPPPGPPPPLTTTQYQPPPGPPPPLTTTKYQPPPGPPPPPTSATHLTPGRPPFNYQLSKCNGRKRALLIGINYFNTQYELKGCINDVNNIKRFLIELYNFRESDMVILTDDQTNPNNIPNRANIIRAMHWLVNGAAANDSFFFHFSGHGGQEKDRNNDEEDGYDESIMPVDFKRNGTIIDDEMHAIMVRPLPPGVRLTAIFDSCHSGTALDLPYVYSTRGMIKEPSIISDGGNAILTVGKSYLRGDITGIKTTLVSFGKKVVSGNKISQKNKQNKSSPADVIMFSGCKDIQTSADTHEAGQNTGAMSYAFIKTLRSNRNISYQQLLNCIRDILAEKYSQKPQLSSSHPMDMNLLFVM